MGETLQEMLAREAEEAEEASAAAERGDIPAIPMVRARPSRGKPSQVHQ